jgi:hypothetical protein
MSIPDIAVIVMPAVFCDYQDKVRDCGVGHEQFLTSEFGTCGGDFQAGRIPTRAGFEKGDGGAGLPFTDGPEIFLFVFRARYRVDYSACERNSRKEGPGQQGATSFFHQQNEFDFTETHAAEFLRENNPGVALFSQFRPEFFVVRCAGFHQTADFFHWTFACKEFAGAVFQDLLAFTQSKFHCLSPW